MKKNKLFGTIIMVYILALGLFSPAGWAAEEYKVTVQDLKNAKKSFDDPRPYFKELSSKKVIPPNIYSKLTYDVETMKSRWAEVVGFRSPDVVGKIAPEIKPGTYNYKDKEKYPGLKELMIPELYRRFKPGERPFAGNFPEIKVVPTVQRYFALPIAEATKKYAGTVRLDDKGFMREETYMAGVPFPRPEGKFMANEIIYNWLRRYHNGESHWITQVGLGFTGSHQLDAERLIDGPTAKLNGRVCIEPYGWFDERAKKQGEDRALGGFYHAPRDYYGQGIHITSYMSPEKFDLMMVYIPGLRRTRMLSSTDVQDSAGGADNIYLDMEGYSHKLSDSFFPYKAELIGEREYLMPVCSDGSNYLSSEGLELRNLEFERRPMYVVKTTSLDKNFVYGHRLIYFDKETWHLLFIENYDRKGRLYRTFLTIPRFEPEMGLPILAQTLQIDHIDLHSSYSIFYVLPVTWLTRNDFDMSSLFRRGK